MSDQRAAPDCAVPTQLDKPGAADVPFPVTVLATSDLSAPETEHPCCRGVGGHETWCDMPTSLKVATPSLDPPKITPELAAQLADEGARASNEYLRRTRLMLGPPQSLAELQARIALERKVEIAAHDAEVAQLRDALDKVHALLREADSRAVEWARLISLLGQQAKELVMYLGGATCGSATGDLQESVHLVGDLKRALAKMDRSRDYWAGKVVALQARLPHKAKKPARKARRARS